MIVAMEGYNGYARPLDQEVQRRGYTLLNVNNPKLRRFKELFPSPAKTDAIDARRITELVRLKEVLPRDKEILQEVSVVPKNHQMLKRLTRRRRQLVNEKVAIANRMQSDIQAVSPGLLELVKNKDGVAFLSFLTSRDNLEQLKGIRKGSLLKVKGIGEGFAEKIMAWQKRAYFSEETPYVGPMIIEDAKRMMELIGETGSISRFDTESSLAMYFGMAPLDNSSGSYRGTRQACQVNKRARAAMMVATMRHIPQTEE